MLSRQSRIHATSSRTLSLPLLIFIIFTTIASPALAQPPVSRLRLIAAMPKNCESVMLLDYQTLQRDDSVYRNLWGIKRPPSSQPAPADDPTANLGHRLESAATRAKPLFHVHAGSDFSPSGQDPKNPLIGGGKYTQRGIWIVRQSLADFEKALQLPKSDRPDPAHNSDKTPDSVRIYQGKADWDIPSFGGPAIEKDFFLAFPDDHTVLYANSRADLVEMFENWISPNPAMPPQWAAAAQDVDLEAARLLILRRFDRTNALDFYSPVNPRLPKEARIDVDSLSLAVTDETKPSFQMRINTTDRDRASSWLQKEWFHTFDADSRAIDTDLEFHVNCPLDPDSSISCESMLLLYLIFGMNIVI